MIFNHSIFVIAISIMTLSFCVENKYPLGKIVGSLNSDNYYTLLSRVQSNDLNVNDKIDFNLEEEIENIRNCNQQLLKNFNCDGKQFSEGIKYFIYLHAVMDLIKGNSIQNQKEIIDQINDQLANNNNNTITWLEYLDNKFKKKSANISTLYNEENKKITIQSEKILKNLALYRAFSLFYDNSIVRSFLELKKNDNSLLWPFDANEILVKFNNEERSDNSLDYLLVSYELYKSLNFKRKANNQLLSIKHDFNIKFTIIKRD